MENGKEYTDNQIRWLKHFIDAELKSVRDAVDKAERTSKEAIDKVERTNKDYRESQNEWRGQLNDQADTFATKESVDNSRELQNKRLDKLDNAKSNMEGRLWVIGAIWAILAILLSWYMNNK